MEERKIVLRGPETGAVVSTTDEKKSEKFDHFISWLSEYRPAAYTVGEPYPIETEKKLMSCRLMARRLGLEVSVLN